MVESGMITRSTEEWEMSRSCQRVTFSRAATALPRSSRAMPAMRSQMMGLRLWGMAEDPFWPLAKGSSASRISIRCRARPSGAIFSQVARVMERVDVSVSAHRSRELAVADDLAGPAQPFDVAHHLEGIERQLVAERGGLGVD